MKTLSNAAEIAEIRARMERLTPECSRRWGKMNVCQMVCHVADSFNMVVTCQCGAPIKTALPPATMKWLALQLPMRWPKNVKTAPEVEQGKGGTPPSQWELDYARLLRVFHAFCAKREDWPEHPFFRQMTQADWMRWGYLHSDHHLRQFGV